MNHALWPAVAGTFRRAAPPLAWYYVVTLALPLANGAAQAGAFAEHALVVLILPPVLIVLASVTREMARALSRRARADLSSSRHLRSTRVADIRQLSARPPYD